MRGRGVGYHTDVSWVPIVMIVGIAVVNLVLRVIANKGGSAAVPGKSAQGNLEALKVLAEQLARDPQAARRASSQSSASEGGAPAPRRVVRAEAPVPNPAPMSTARPPKPPPPTATVRPRKAERTEERVPDRVTPKPSPVVAAIASSPPRSRLAVAPRPVARRTMDRQWLRQAMTSSILLGPPKSLES